METKTGDDISKQHQVMKIENNFAENEKDISLNGQEKRKTLAKLTKSIQKLLGSLTFAF